MILDRIVESTRERVAAAKANVPLDEMRARAQKSEKPFAFENAINKGDIAFICEVKKASPSKGVISADFPYVDIAREYEAAGADAISVLTEPQFFMGANNYLTEIKQAVDIPVLRKDFVIDEYQIYEARAIGADAVLLICSILDTIAIDKYIQIADALGMSALVEAHDETELKSALDAGARVVGVNNRDLKTFNVDINNSAKLRKLAPSNIIFVSESGITTPGDIATLRENGTNAVLIGETLMKSGNKKQALNLLKH